MALINCPECGKEISDSAQFCPCCGYLSFVKSFGEKRGIQKQNFGRIWKAWIIVIGITFFIYYLLVLALF